MAVQPIPEGYHTLQIYLAVEDASKAIDFYKQAFGAKERMRLAGPDGRLMHAELLVGDSIVMLGEEMPEMGCKAPVSVGAVSSSLYVYVPDVDAAFNRAVQAGAKALMPPADMFWGDRFGTVEDPSGHRWGLATHKEDPSPAEMEKRKNEFFAAMAKPKR